MISVSVIEAVVSITCSRFRSRPIDWRLALTYCVVAQLLHLWVTVRERERERERMRERGRERGERGEREVERE